MHVCKFEVDQLDYIFSTENVVAGSIASMAQFKELGNAKYKVGKYQEAADAYGKAIEAEPKEATYYGNRASALLMLKKYDEALEDCRLAIELDPSFVKGYVRSDQIATFDSSVILAMRLP